MQGKQLLYVRELYLVTVIYVLNSNCSLKYKFIRVTTRRLIGLVRRVFSNGPGYLGSIQDCVILKTNGT